MDKTADNGIKAKGVCEPIYHSVFEFAQDGIVIEDKDGHYLDANPSACKMLGYTHDEIVRLQSSNIVAPKELAHIQLALEAINSKGIYFSEWQLRRKDGSVFPAEVMSTIMPDGNRLGIIRDITDRKQTENIAAKLSAIVESSVDAIISKDLNGIITSWNIGAESIFGYTEDEVVGTSIARLIPKELQAEEEFILGEIRRGEKVEHFETQRLAKDQRLIEMSITVSPVKDSRGKIVGASKIARDITQRKITEAKLQRITQLYSALSQCNQAIVRCSSETELFPQVCRCAVEFGGMNMAWIGMLDEATRLVNPLASFGSGIEYLEGMEISVDANTPTGRGPAGTAINKSAPVWCQDFANDPTAEFWRAHAKRFDWGSAAALPLYRMGSTVGVFVLHSDAANSFDKAAQNLLTEMAMDISFALERFQNEAERKLEQGQLAYLANFDTLTGLPNRVQLDHRLKYVLSIAKRNNRHFAMMFIDIDRFKDMFQCRPEKHGKT